MPTTSDLPQLFAATLPHEDPVRLALLIARIGTPDLDCELYVGKLDEMAEAVAARVHEAEGGEARALALVQAIRLDLGLRGNVERYYDATNSFLNVVMDRQMGLPIMLSLILVAIGKRLGLRVDGVGFPGHFMARYEDEAGTWFLDPFHGGVLVAADVPAYFEKLFGNSSMRMEAAYFAPFPATAWAQRILNNLHAVYVNAGDLTMLAKVLPLMVVMEPTRPELWQELGLVEYRRGELSNAVRALRRYFFLLGHLVVSAPNSILPTAPANLDGAERQLWHLLEEMESARTRWN
jgi:regulator of sirC expression with transglutaminase-like and TPR domain